MTGVLQLLLSLQGEWWKISIPSRPIQKHSNLQAQQTEQIFNEARVFWGSIVKTKRQRLTNHAFM